MNAKIYSLDDYRKEEHKVQRPASKYDNIRKRYCFKRDKNLERQIDKIVEFLNKKMQSYRRQHNKSPER